MTRLKEELKTLKGKLHLIIWLLYFTVTTVIYLYNSGAVLGEEKGRPFWIWILYFGVLAAIALCIVYCTRKWLFDKIPRNEKGKELIGSFKIRHLIIFAAVSVFAFLIMELVNNYEKLLEMKPLYMAMNIIGCYIMMLILMAWLNSFKRTCIAIIAFTTTMSFIFYYVYLCRGEPLQFIDIFSFTTAMEVAGGYSFVFTRWITVMLTLVLCFMAVIMHSRDYRWAKSLKARLLSRVGVFIFMIAAYFFYINVSWNSAAGIVTDLWAPHDTYEEVGTNVGFFCVAKFMRNTPPEGYSVAEAERIALESVEEYKEKEEDIITDDVIKPVNIIAIMNEAWADYGVFDKFETTTDYQPFFNSMQENTIKGHTLVCISGGGTAKTEYEFLTGNSVKQYPGMVPYVSYYTHDQYSLVSTLEAQGYQTAAMHPNKGTNWNRNTAYRLLGFDEFYDIDSFDEDAEKFRNMISDRENYEKIIEVIESKEDPSQPFFLFDITMQNHGGYTGKSFPISVKAEGYTDDAWNRYLSLVKESDDALQYLIEYFEDCDEPTMIVMFGDHFPSLDEGVEKFLSGDTRDSLDIYEMQQYYQTPFFIWTNYDMEAKSDVITSTNFLGTLMMEQTGLELTDFEKYQILLMDDITAYNHKGYVDSQGNYLLWADAPDNIRQETLEYEYLQYNALVENSNRLDWFFTLEEENG